MHPARAAEGHQGQVPRVKPTFHRDHPQRPDHLRVGNGDHTGRRGHRSQVSPGRPRCARPQFHTESCQRRVGGRARQDDLAAEARAVGQIAEHQVRVGHRGLRAPAAIAGRAGIGTSRAWPDPQGTPGVHPCHRPAAGAHRVHVHRGQRDRYAGQHRLGGDLRTSPQHRRDIGGRSAHVEGKQIGHARQPRDVGGTDHSAGRP